MNFKFNTIALTSKQSDPNTIDTLKKIIAYCHEKKIKLVLENQTAKLLNKSDKSLPFDDLAKHADLLVVVGGDGSLLSAARNACKQNLPILGVNCGRLGFLNDIYPDKIAQISAIIAGEFSVEERFLLSVEVKEKNKIIWQDLALNDAVLLSGNAGHIVYFSVQIKDRFVCTYGADGLIIATPTGSTAHALSGGGPILHPELNAIALVPMLSHNLSSRPIVIDANNIIKITLAKNNIEAARVSCDGQMHTAVMPGYEIHITKAREKVHLIHPLDYDYFEALRTKLHWEKKF